MSAFECEKCGREFAKQAYLEVHPCPKIVGKKKARAIRSMANPAQYRLDEFETGGPQREGVTDE